MFEFKIVQLFREVTLTVKYEDGEIYYETKDLRSIVNFIEVVGAPEDCDKYIAIYQGFCTDNELQAWYRKDKAEMIVA